MRKHSDLAGSDAYPGEEPQAKADRERLQPRPDYTVAPERQPEEYNWVLNGTVMAVHEDASHEQLFRELEHEDFSRPYAYGHLILHSNWEAVWQIVHTNMALHEVVKRVKKYSRDQGWKYSGIVDETGMPFEGESIKMSVVKVAEVPGIGQINPGVKDWHNKEWGDTQQWDQINQVEFYGEQNYKDEHNPLNPHVCSECGELMTNYNQWRQHVLDEHVNPRRTPPRLPAPVVDLDQVLPADFNQNVMDRTVMRQSSLMLTKLAQSPSTQIAGPIPFLFDIEQDRIYVGHPGERHADIKGRFTPGGIVEGVYDPKGHVQIRTDTDMPYTVRHMIDLWYAMHPELEVKGLFLLVGDKKYKLASSNVGHKVRNLAAANSAAWSVYELLQPYGAIYAVGQAVRNVIANKEVADFHLITAGIDFDDLQSLLSTLPGTVASLQDRVALIYTDFETSASVEVSPARKPSKDKVARAEFAFEISKDATIENELSLREFTADAIAVNLKTGTLIDPYDGVSDVKSNYLNVVRTSVFDDTPIRLLQVLGSVANYGLQPSEKMIKALRQHGHRLAEESPKRFAESINQMMSGSFPHVALRLAFDTGLSNYLMPHLLEAQFDEDLTLRALQHVASLNQDVDVRIASVIFETAASDSREETARRILNRLCFNDSRVERIAHLVKNCNGKPFYSESGARRFIARVHDEHVDDLIDLQHAHSFANTKSDRETQSIVLQRQIVAQVRNPADIKESNILDPIQDGLDANVFDLADSAAPRVKPKIVSWVRSQVFKTMRDAGWPDPTQYLSLVLTGSLTTYQWSEDSDFDISLFVDAERFPDWVRADLIKLMIDKLDGKTVIGTTHPLQVFVVPPEVTREQLYKPGLRSAYDLDKDEWIVLPERERSIDVSQRWPELITYAKMVEDKMRLLLKYDPPGAKAYWHFIHDRRRQDQKAGKGDYSESNITYKWLANRGLFPVISEITGEYIA